MSNHDDLREQIARKLKANPGMKTAMLAETLGIAEGEVLRAMPGGLATELALDRLEELIRGLEPLGLLYVVCRTEACVAEIKGRFAGFSRSGPFFNVAGDNLHLHLRLDRVAQAFALRHPFDLEQSATSASFQFFQRDGASAFKVFLLPALKKQASENVDEAFEGWNALIAKHARVVEPLTRDSVMA